MNRDFLARWSWRGILAFGVVILIVGAVMFVRTVSFVAEAEHVTGTVIELSRDRDSEGTVTYHPVVRFVTADGETIEFVSSTGFSLASESPGDRVEVLYDPDDPYGAQLSGIFHVWLLPAALAIVGAASVAKAWRRRMRMTSVTDAEWLRAHGHHLNGDSPRVVTDSVEIDGRSPFRLEVDVHDATTDEVRVLTSNPIWFDPTPHLENRKTLDVYVDPGRPERYLVDISFLPRLAD